MRYKAIVEYLGTDFVGWQRQDNGLSIQEVVENAIFQFSDDQVTTYVAGRTDAGVHASGQVCHFDLRKEYDPHIVMRAMNHFLKPHTVAIIGCKVVDQEFHARFSAISRSYVYKICNRRAPTVIHRDRMWWIHDDLDVSAMQEAANFLIGNHDFTSFRASQCQAKSPIKTINSILLSKESDVISVHIEAPSFLHHMVRNIVGTLVLVGMRKWQPIDVKVALEKKSRASAGITAPSCGLYLTSVTY